MNFRCPSTYATVYMLNPILAWLATSYGKPYKFTIRAVHIMRYVEDYRNANNSLQ